MKKETAYGLAHIAAGLLIGGIFFMNFVGVMYASNYLLPDRPGVALLAGLIAGVGAVAWMGRIARQDNERHEKEEI
jgi:ABC-type thiamin/hydroxymethylpyrimidine transport system permease subunit